MVGIRPNPFFVRRILLVAFAETVMHPGDITDAADPGNCPP
ncbi:hypothetical protein [Actinomycetospora atypica]|uniref:Uncharacterized protein n=1 Tax=Actinomycetospora atypica TaxID=1290095 RepID=A0ABV9YJW9_9PSEU